MTTESRSDRAASAELESFAVEEDVPGGPSAAASARGLVRRALADRVPAGTLGDVALLVTELVANGVRHGGAGVGRVLRVRIERRGAALRVEVVDPGSRRGGIAPRRPDLRGGGGLGLHIVDRLASRWGVRQESRTAVWFELDERR